MMAVKRHMQGGHPSAERVDGGIFGKKDVRVAGFMIAKIAFCHRTERIGMVGMHMGEEISFNLFGFDAAVFEKVFDRCADIHHKAKAVMFHINRGAIAAHFGMSVTGAEKCKFHVNAPFLQSITLTYIIRQKERFVNRKKGGFFC